MKEIDALVTDALANLVGGKNQHEQAIRAALLEARALIGEAK